MSRRPSFDLWPDVERRSADLFKHVISRGHCRVTALWPDREVKINAID